MTVKILLVLCVVVLVNGSFPPFIQRCRSNDNVCINKSARRALNVIINGYPPLNFPRLLPFPFKNVTLKLTPTLNFTFNGNGNVFPVLTISKINMSLAQNLFEFTMNDDKDDIRGNFTVRGQFEGKNIKASGRFITTYFGEAVSYKARLINRNNTLQVTSPNCQLTYVRSSDFFINVQVQGIPTSDVALLEEAMSSLSTKLANYIQNIAKNIITQVVNTILGLVPANQVFLSASV